MTAESVSKTVVAKEWLKECPGVGVNYLAIFSLNYDNIMIKYEYGSSTVCYGYLINRYGSPDAEYNMITL